MNKSNVDALQASSLSTHGLFKGMHKGMTIFSALLVSAFVMFTAFFSEYAGSIFGIVRAWVEDVFGWYYMITIVGLILICAFLIVTKYGSIRLGADDSKPDYSNFTWFSMLFSAGIGIGILFFGVAEPIFYLDNSGVFGYPNNPYADIAGATAMNAERAIDALRVTYFHWGFHGWAVYVVVGMALAFFAYRKNLPLALRSTLYPFIGDRIYGPIGHFVDVLGVLACVFGVATSLGLGVSQMAVGLERLFGVDSGFQTQLFLIIGISIISIISAVSGVNRGIKLISQMNVFVSIFVVGFFLFGGPTTWLIKTFFASTADYVVNFMQMGVWFPEDEAQALWQKGWTVFYWGWWLAWAPFVGLFIARISKGRTIREFMIGVLIVPTVVIFIWLCIFGGTAMYQELNAAGGVGTAGIMDEVKNWNLPQALFVSADGIAGTGIFGWILSASMVFLLMSWFVTSSDSATLVLTTVLSFGNENPPQKFRIFWGVVIGFVAAALLYAGGLSALQTALIVTALPMSVLVIVMTLGVIKSVLFDSKYQS